MAMMTNSAGKPKADLLAVISVPHLKARGWTDALIRDLLGAHDREIVNSGTAPTRLYNLARVELVEANSHWPAIRAAAARHNAVVVMIADAKQQQLLAEVEALAINVPEESLDDLYWRVSRNYAARQKEQAYRLRCGIADNERVSVTSYFEPAFLERIAVTYLRYRLTAHARYSVMKSDRLDMQEANEKIYAKVYDAICAAYPELADEATRQMLPSISTSVSVTDQSHAMSINSLPHPKAGRVGACASRDASPRQGSNVQ